MRDPIKAIDSWASQSGDRAALIMWVLVIAMALIVAVGMAGIYLYTAPTPPLR